MKNSNRIISFILLIALIFIKADLIAQVGIDNISPSKYAVLDMNAIDKGFMIPKMGETERFALLTACSPNCPNGLMVYDSTKTDFFYINNNLWYAISSFMTSDTASVGGEPTQLNLGLFSNVGIGTVPSANYKLDVNGDVLHRGLTNMQDSLVVTNGMAIATGNLTVSTNDLIVTAGNLYAEKQLLANGFSSSDTAKNMNGPIPKGGIIMWSGSIASIPVGWALCDGSIKNGITTPDLRERFIVGAGSANYTLGGTGGENFHVLSVAELPVHTHTGYTSLDGDHQHTYNGSVEVSNTPFACSKGKVNCKSSGRDGGDGGISDGMLPAGKHTHTLTLSNAGSSQAHENRPPYYALAYIIKI